jgi:ABC-type ATPase involved in cell division
MVNSTKSHFSIPIEIKNLGAVHQTKIDLKPLTVFIGENNTGKTYSAYLIGYIFSKHSFLDFLYIYNKGKTTTKFPELEKLIDDILATGTGSINLKDFVKANTQKFFSVICDEIATKQFKTFLGSTSIEFDKMHVKLKTGNCLDIQLNNISENIPCYLENFRNSPVGKDFSFSINKKTYLVSIATKKENTKRENIQKFVYIALFMPLHRSIFNETYFLGAERTGLSLFIHSKTTKKEDPIDKETEKLRKELIKDEKKHEPRPIRIELAQHVSALLTNYQFFLDEKVISEFRKKQLKIKPKSQIYLKLADVLENAILGGKIGLDRGKDITKLVFNYKQAGDIHLNMPITASSVKGLSPLVLYLRYLVEPDEFLIIDEPEMNLHPKAQAEIIELLAMIANSGVRILITTHSPYIVDHLKNLMKAEQVKNKSKAKELFFLKDSSAFISKKDVSIYLFKDGQGKSILSKSGEINWRSFSRVSEDIVKISLDLED